MLRHRTQKGGGGSNLLLVGSRFHSSSPIGFGMKVAIWLADRPRHANGHTLKPYTPCKWAYPKPLHARRTTPAAYRW